MSSITEQCLLRATTETFETLVLLVPDVALTTEQQGAPLEVTVSVEFRGAQHGRLVVRASAAVLPVIAANMLGETASRQTPLQRDALGELANVICGNVLPEIAGPRAVFRLDAPRVHGAHEPERAPSRWDTPTARTVFGIEDGRVEVELFLFAAPANGAVAMQASA